MAPYALCDGMGAWLGLLLTFGAQWVCTREHVTFRATACVLVGLCLALVALMGARFICEVEPFTVRKVSCWTLKHRPAIGLPLCPRAPIVGKIVSILLALVNFRCLAIAL